jgi:hypothetical protein
MSMACSRECHTLWAGCTRRSPCYPWPQRMVFMINGQVRGPLREHEASRGASPPPAYHRPAGTSSSPGTRARPRPAATGHCHAAHPARFGDRMAGPLRDRGFEISICERDRHMRLTR